MSSRIWGSQGLLHSVVVSISALHAEGPGIIPQVEPQTILQVSQAPEYARPPSAQGGARPWYTPRMCGRRCSTFRDPVLQGKGQHRSGVELEWRGGIKKEGKKGSGLFPSFCLCFVFRLVPFGHKMAAAILGICTASHKSIPKCKGMGRGNNSLHGSLSFYQEVKSFLRIP